MGAADFNTSATISGTKEEVFAILKVMHKYATEKREQYREKRNCPYLTHINISGENEFGMHQPISNFTDEELMAFIDSKNCAIFVEAGGPYGVFNTLERVLLFHEMAETAPNATFQGGMGGFDPGGDHCAAFELKDKKLSCKYASREHGWEDDEFDEEWDEDDEDENWEEEEPDWDTEVIYDPVNKKNVRN